jgi:hypothetical protein
MGWAAMNCWQGGGGGESCQRGRCAIYLVGCPLKGALSVSLRGHLGTSSTKFVTVRPVQYGTDHHRVCDIAYWYK